MNSIIKKTTLFCATFFTQQLFASEPTNFIVLFLDDMGYGDIEETGAIQREKLME
jgi:hypothetical protein